MRDKDLFGIYIPRFISESSWWSFLA